MDLGKLKIELEIDPLNRGYSNMTTEEIITSLNTPNIPRYKSLTSAELLAWAASNRRRKKLVNASLNHVSEDIQNLAEVAVILLDRDGTQIDLNLPDRVQMVEILVAAGVLDASDKTDLYALATYNISRNQELNLGEIMNGDVLAVK
jgi:hypothetical protein